MKKIIIALFLLFSVIQAKAVLDIILIERIFSQVGASNGYLDKEMHTAFWKELRKSGTEEEAQVVLRFLKKSLLSAQDRQRENYRSALLSGVWNTSDGRSIKMTKELIERILRDMDKSFNRFDRLFNQRWTN